MNYELDGRHGARLKCTLVLWWSEETCDSFRQSEPTARNAAAARADLQVDRCGSVQLLSHIAPPSCTFRKQQFRLQK